MSERAIAFVEEWVSENTLLSSWRLRSKLRIDDEVARLASEDDSF